MDDIWMAVLGGVWTCLVFLGWVFTILTPLAIVSHIIHWAFGPKGVDYGYTEMAAKVLGSALQVFFVSLSGTLISLFAPVLAPFTVTLWFYPFIICPLGLLLLFYLSAFDLRKWRAVWLSLRSRGDDIDMTDHLVS
jgi:hypothetical protein